MAQTEKLATTTEALWSSQPRAAQRPFWTVRRKRFVGHSIIYIVMTALAIVFLIPAFWMLSTAVKPNALIWLWPPQWIPSTILWENFAEVFRLVPFGRFFTNTMILMFWNLIGTVLSCTLVAYGFARLRFPGRNALFMVLLATMMIPGTVTMIPEFILYKLLGWYNTYLPLIVPSFFGGAFFIFLLRQYMMTIPFELDDAARIDGCNRFQTLWHVMLPLCVPPITILVVWTSMGVWNNFVGPLIYLEDLEKYPLAVGLAMFRSIFPGQTRWNLLMAASLMMVIPPVIIYYFAQDKLIGGIASVGLKG